MFLCIAFIFSLDSSLYIEPNPISAFQALQQNIRQERISKDSAISAFRLIIKALNIYYEEYGVESSEARDWRFPVEGYFHHAIGGGGKGYRAYGFDFFQKTRHNPHPAHDIFIDDKNQDELDDDTGEPVNVLSISSGIVVEAQKEWLEGSSGRGGKYVWIYDATHRRFYYYAHLRSVFVEAGECVASGLPIGEVGRTGYNAFKRRSPTHLHLMVLKIDKNGLPKPFNPYRELRKMKSR